MNGCSTKSRVTMLRTGNTTRESPLCPRFVRIYMLILAKGETDG